MPNEFLNKRMPLIDKLKRAMLEYHYSGAYGGNLPLTQMMEMLDEMVSEIRGLQMRVDSTEGKLNDLVSGFTMLGADVDENDVTVLKAKVVSLQKDNEEKQERITNLKTQVQQLQGKK
jgi:polyhydroxyalkanoate synthesis regulator phasin